MSAHRVQYQNHLDNGIYFIEICTTKLYSKTPHESEQPVELPKSSENPPVSESHDQADDQEPLSELGDLPGISPVYVPTGVERR